ncbi:glutathione S-transferase family protein [Aestuariivirga litoralis]|uniref:glutathione S-transferase family protein n=1 Tax=Aestuariivirga litoralis TaxID=2650924 RepID=UPI0018C81C70|nr:glutathione S-transferase family protein [Aestuariivirga litoralis]MBG1231489.1 glutathione S-transferase family protein [Aestuariivirga litoralis]
MAQKPKRAVAKSATKTMAKAKASPVKKSPKKEKGPSPKERQRFTLYGSATSGPTYTAALALSLMKHPYSYIHVNLREGAHKQPDYLVKNRYGQVPALRDGQIYAVQSAAILMHLAESLDKFNSKVPVEKQRIREWLFWQWDKLAVPVFRLRAQQRGTRQFGSEVRTMYDTEAKAALAVLEQELGKSPWIVGKKASIADIGVYGVLRYAPEAGIDLSHYPHLQAWKKHFEELPGFATPEQLLPLESRLI